MLEIIKIDKFLIKENLKFISNFQYFIITMGKEGCFVVKDKKIFFVPTVYTSIKDTTGSGDIFFYIFKFDYFKQSRC